MLIYLFLIIKMTYKKREDINVFSSDKNTFQKK